MSRQSRILALDIETCAAKVWTFQLRDISIGVDQIIEPGRPICWAAQWYGERAIHYADERGGAKPMFEGIHALMSAADGLLTYNGNRFDLQKLNGSFILHGLPPLPPVASIDLWVTASKLGLDSSKLAFVGPHFGIGEKIKHEGFDLWKKCMAGDAAAWGRMEKYCKRDTAMLGPLYTLLRPWIKTHPFLGKPDKPKSAGAECPRCGSRNTQNRGIRRTRAFVIQRMQCLGCGGWSDGTRKAVT